MMTRAKTPRLALVVPLLVSVVLASCASIQRSQDQGTVRQVAALINSGDSARLASLSASPFLLDGEIVPLPADVASFWQGIAKAGFRVEGAALDKGAPVGAESYRDFAATMEVKSFFARYVKDGTRILELTTSAGTRIRILTLSQWFSWKILGFKGPF
jgi:hypothetical protein